MDGNEESDECPRLEPTAQEVLLGRQLSVAVSCTGMTATMVQVFIQPKTKVATTKIRQEYRSGVGFKKPIPTNSESPRKFPEIFGNSRIIYQFSRPSLKL